MLNTPSSDGPPSTPANCAETPTHTMPSRIMRVWAPIRSGAASRPPLTFSHSTTTVPLNRLGDVGRSTTMRVLYAAVSPGVTVHRPSLPSGAALEKAVAVPEMKYSSST